MQTLRTRDARQALPRSSDVVSIKTSATAFRQKDQTIQTTASKPQRMTRPEGGEQQRVTDQRKQNAAAEGHYVR